MINIKDQVYAQLEGVLDNVTDTYPSNWANLPAVQYTEEDNSVAEWTDNEEQISHVAYRIDIWDSKSTSKTALDIDRVLASFGLKRVSCRDLDDTSGLRHKQMRYEAYYDNDFIYLGMNSH